MLKESKGSSNKIIYMDNACLLERLCKKDKSYDTRKITRIMYALLKLSIGRRSFANNDGILNLYLWNVYLNLALEVNEKILIPRGITIEEYINLLKEK